MNQHHSRRSFITQTSLGATSLGLAEILKTRTAPAHITHPGAIPDTQWGLQFGDVDDDSALVWSRTDRNALMRVEWSLRENSRHFRYGGSVFVSEHTDFTGRLTLRGLPADSLILVRVSFETLGHKKGRSDVLLGRFVTAPRRCRDLRFVWGGDTVGQGWGIDPSQGGMKLYEAMRQTSPDFFIHSGDNIYADGPLAPQVTDPSGTVIWENAYLEEIPEKLKVAETLHEFRRNYLYNRMDEHLRSFTAEVPQIWQWDDHETVNNWSPSKVLDSRYTQVTDIATLVGNSRRAFLEHAPMSYGRGDKLGRIYRRVSYGDDLDIFVLDMRSYRAGNSCNDQSEPAPSTVFLGEEQLEWLERELKKSRATWKVIASDMPIGLVVGDGTDPESGCPRAENSSNTDGPVLGREFEIARILSYIKHKRVKNVVWLTADVHYAAAHYYDPSIAEYDDFEPFWEFVSGPLHAGSFGPNALDNTFGPTVVFEKAPPAGQANLAPNAGYQFFGQVDIDGHSKTMTVTLKDAAGVPIYSTDLQAK